MIHIWLLFALFLALSVPAGADQVRYFYDELGRLVGVADGAGNMAVYTYDAVGNILSIQRFSAATGGIGIFFISPSSGAVGTQVEIRGFGFSATASDNQVAFNGRPATVLSSSANSITAVVPVDASTGPVTVINANGTAVSPQPFTVVGAPVIQGIDPNRVAQGSTNPAVISGDNLGTATAVQFTQGGLSAAIVGVSAHQLQIVLAVAGNVPVGSYAFSVTSRIGVAQSGTITVNVAPPTPSLTVANPPLSVFMPHLPNVGASGPGIAVAPLSIFMPVPEATAPSGSSMSVAPPVSVSLP